MGGTLPRWPAKFSLSAIVRSLHLLRLQRPRNPYQNVPFPAFAAIVPVLEPVNAITEICADPVKFGGHGALRIALPFGLIGAPFPALATVFVTPLMLNNTNATPALLRFDTITSAPMGTKNVVFVAALVLYESTTPPAAAGSKGFPNAIV
jgi:hypothetical protein